ncbi:P-loop NTPase fold protein [Sphingomonas sp.]|uniref:KAP family P-loop NTPase fold protein n=1 Tax=Sphingomonas sp. TaxID=28214 RepID=UPI001AFD09EB|nr:P-loop NTPase fold protein [Sphingomonas sp.]MBO9712627.1 hypothetical protein [Sphingomonas sp.]
MATHTNNSIKGDRALGPGDKDELGFREVAARIAVSLIDHASDDGLVIGIEGAWGSGKSSLVFLIEDELQKLPKEQRPSVINFRPWLIGNRDALINGLFTELSKQLDRVALDAGDATPITIARAKKAEDALREFASGLTKVGAAIEFIGDVSGLPPVKWFGKGTKAAANLAEGKRAASQLSDLKDKLVRSLRDLGHRFVITIDDVDRLEPAEVIEILRLVRSVADFPNVIYLLCYDGKILAHSIEKAARAKSGKAYLEKIIQLTIMVPQPESMQLRQWFTDSLHQIAAPKNDDELSRLKTVVDFEGGRQLRTPRSVVRALDSIRFFWPPLRDAKADLADLVWLQLIKDGNPALYRWIEEYCAAAAIHSLGIARVSDVEKTRELSKLINITEEGHFDDLTYRHYFADQLAGVEMNYGDDGDKFRIFQHVHEHQRDAAIRGVRLASPDHYRLYFALAGPSHALTQDDFTSMWAAAEAGVEQTTAELLRLHGEPAGGSFTKADILLERIRGSAFEVLTPQQCDNILLGLSQAMDAAYRQRPFDRFWINSLWDRASRLIPLLLAQLDAEQRAAAVTTMFQHGAALAWLTTVFRHETFAHGRYGDRPRPTEDWLVTNPELDQINGIMLDRYRALSDHEILEVIDPISLLFAWRQGGDEAGPRERLEANIVSDEGLVETLEKLVSSVDSSNRGRFDVIKRDNLAPFLDYDEAAQRIEALRNHSELGERASRLAVAFADGLEF